jgi:hypothetical protein
MSEFYLSILLGVIGLLSVYFSSKDEKHFKALFFFALLNFGVGAGLAFKTYSEACEEKILLEKSGELFAQKQKEIEEIARSLKK